MDCVEDLTFKNCKQIKFDDSNSKWICGECDNTYYISNGKCCLENFYFNEEY